MAQGGWSRRKRGVGLLTVGVGLLLGGGGGPAVLAAYHPPAQVVDAKLTHDLDELTVTTDKPVTPRSEFLVELLRGEQIIYTQQFQRVSERTLTLTRLREGHLDELPDGRYHWRLRVCGWRAIDHRIGQLGPECTPPLVRSFDLDRQRVERSDLRVLAPTIVERPAGQWALAATVCNAGTGTTFSHHRQPRVEWSLIPDGLPKKKHRQRQNQRRKKPLPEPLTSTVTLTADGEFWPRGECRAVAQWDLPTAERGRLQTNRYRVCVRAPEWSEAETDNNCTEGYLRDGFDLLPGQHGRTATITRDPHTRRRLPKTHQVLASGHVHYPEPSTAQHTTRRRRLTHAQSLTQRSGQGFTQRLQAHTAQRAAAATGPYVPALPRETPTPYNETGSRPDLTQRWGGWLTGPSVAPYATHVWPTSPTEDLGY